jgi:hypothetical protein
MTINYGDKSNEELLFLYGFAVPHNPAEVLTLMCPLPPAAEWDAPLRARLLLLARRGLSPRLHLPAADLPAVADAGSKGLAAGLPEGVLETLEVFIMEPQQVARELQAAEAAEAAAAAAGSAVAVPAAPAAVSASSSSGSGASEADVAGRRMAVLTTLVRLLELKILEMEGGEQGVAEPAIVLHDLYACCEVAVETPALACAATAAATATATAAIIPLISCAAAPAGTGLLEHDEQLLAGAGEALSRNQRHALLYRIGQKQLARAYLVQAKQLLQQQMAHLQRLQQQ